MVNILRCIIVCCIQALLNISNISPNVNSENQNNKQHLFPANQNKFTDCIYYIGIWNFISCLHLFFYGDLDLSTIDIWICYGILFGFGLRMYCYYVLGKFFTFDLCVKQNHQLIKTGPYKYLVHPSYTGQLLLIFFTIIFMKFYYVLLFLFLFICIGLTYRMKQEEKMMKIEFGTEYDAYIKQRYRLVPYIY